MEKLKKHGKKLLIILIPIILCIVLISASTYIVMKWIVKKVTQTATQYTKSVSINENGSFSTAVTAKELWDEMKKNGYDVDKYLSGPDELARLMNAELVTQLPDTRPNVDQPINWDAIFNSSSLSSSQWAGDEPEYILHMRDKLEYYEEHYGLSTEYECLIDCDKCRLTIFQKVNNKWKLVLACNSFQGYNEPGHKDDWDGPRSRSFKGVWTVLDPKYQNAYGSALSYMWPTCFVNGGHLEKCANGSCDCQTFEYAHQSNPDDYPVEQRYTLQGCCGVSQENAEWIFKNIAPGNKVIVFDQYNPMPDPNVNYEDVSTRGHIPSKNQSEDIPWRKIKLGKSEKSDEIVEDSDKTETNTDDTKIENDNEYELSADELSSIRPSTQSSSTSKSTNSINSLQGIIRFKRHDKDGNEYYLTYASPTEYYKWIEEYNVNGDQKAREQALTHFTLKKSPKKSNSKISGKGGKAIAEAAVELACSVAVAPDQNLYKAQWPWTRDYNSTTAAYIDARESLIEGKSSDGGDYASCDMAVATAVRYSKVDPNMEYNTTPNIWTYLRNSSEWEDVGEYTRPNPPTNLQPGDVLLSGQPYGHILIYTGNEAVRKKYPTSSADAYEAGYQTTEGESYYPRLFEISKDPRNHITFTIFRHVSSNDVSDETIANISERLVNAAKNTPATAAGHCLEWVDNVWDNAGIAPERLHCACCAKDAHCVSTDRTNIPIGASVYSTGSGASGAHLYGHVGVYIGNGQVMDSVQGIVRTISLNEWAPSNDTNEHNAWLGWGWEDGNKSRGASQDSNSGSTSGNSTSKTDNKSDSGTGVNNSGGPDLEPVIQAALSQVGQPYNSTGSFADVDGWENGALGFNCSGLVWWAFEQGGFEVPHGQCSYGTYSGAPGDMLPTVKENCGGSLITEPSQLKRGDVLFYNTGDGRESGHVAIYLGDGQRVHADGSSVTVDDRAFNEKFIGGGPLVKDGVARGTSNSSSNSNSGYEAVIATYKEVDKSLSYRGAEDLEAGKSFGVSLDTQPEYTLNTTTIDYESMVQPYTLQFDFLWSLLVVGQSKNFVMNLADLAYKSELEVGIYDNLTTTTDIDRWTYKKVTDARIRGSVRYNEISYRVGHTHYYSNGDPQDEYDGYITKTVVTRTNSAVCALTRANTWIADYEQEYNKAPTESNTQNGSKSLKNQLLQDWTEVGSDNDKCNIIGQTIKQLVDDVNKRLKNDYDGKMKQYRNESKSSGGSNNSSVPSEPSYIGEGDVTQDITMETRIRRVEIQDATEDTTVTEKYISGTQKGIIKDDEKTKPNFVTLFNEQKYRQNKNNILSATDWLFEIMEENENLANTLQIFRYLLYKATNINYGVTEFDFQDLMQMTSASSSRGGSGGVLSVTETTLTKEEFVNLVQSYSAAFQYNTQEFRDGAGTIYDICIQEHLNPVLCAAQAWQEQNWHTPVPGNYWGIGVYNGMQDGIHYEGLSGGVKGWCKHVNGILSGNGDSADVYRADSARFSTVNNKFKGDMSTIYDVFSSWAYIGDGHSLQEEADYAAQYVESICQCADQIFGEGVLRP
ncbi:MAG: C40 family peptidase [Clostridia bacterium]|nr:C40 family peptidase [Clostridia bacterium]